MTVLLEDLEIGDCFQHNTAVRFEDDTLFMVINKIPCGKTSPLIYLELLTNGGVETALYVIPDKIVIQVSVEEFDKVASTKH